MMNAKNMKAIGVDHPSLSSKTTIVALNKVIEMILQFLVTEQLLGRGSNAPGGAQMSGAFLPAKRIVKAKDRVSQPSPASKTITANPGHDFVPELDLDTAIRPSEHTVSGPSTQRGVLDTPGKEPVLLATESKRGSTNTLPPHRSPVFFQYQRLQ